MVRLLVELCMTAEALIDWVSVPASNGWRGRSLRHTAQRRRQVRRPSIEYHRLSAMSELNDYADYAARSSSERCLQVAYWPRVTMRRPSAQ